MKKELVHMLVLCMSYRVFNKSIYLFIFGLDAALCIDTVKSRFDQGGTVCTIVTKALVPNCTSVNENGIET